MAKSNISPSANNGFTHIEANNSYADSVSTVFKHNFYHKLVLFPLGKISIVKWIDDSALIEVGTFSEKGRTLFGKRSASFF